MVVKPVFKLAPLSSFRGVLRSLESQDVERLRLRPVQFNAGQSIASQGQEMNHIAFLETGAASVMISLQDGRQVETGFLDSDSIVGLTLLFGETTHRQDVVMQLAGTGYLCTRDNALQEFARSQTFQRLVLNSARTQIAETTQVAGCYAMHQVSQRLSRWLLTCQDRTGCEVIAVTQEVLSQMLGATRPTISMVSEVFERRGLINVRRGRIRVLDRPALEAEACECYGALRELRGAKSSADCRVPRGFPGVAGLTSPNQSFSVARDAAGREGMRRPGLYIQ